MIPLSDPGPPLSPGNRPPWERLPGESEEDYSFFLTYLARRCTIKSLGEIVNLPIPRLNQLSARNRWRARRAAYYLESEIELRDALKPEAETQARAMVQGWTEGLEWAIESVLHARAEGRRLDPREAIAFMKCATEALRLIGGQSTAKVDLDLGNASDEDLAKARDAILALKNGGKNG